MPRKKTPPLPAPSNTDLKGIIASLAKIKASQSSLAKHFKEHQEKVRIDENCVANIERLIITITATLQNIKEEHELGREELESIFVELSENAGKIAFVERMVTAILERINMHPDGQPRNTGVH